MKVPLSVLICILLASCGITPTSVPPTEARRPTPTFIPTHLPTLTSTPDFMQMQRANSNAAHTAQVATVYAIKTETADKTTRIFDEIEKASESIEDLDISAATLVYGPQKGSLIHSIDNFITVDNASLSLKNFIVNITFTNPYDTSTTGTWDYGILFRNQYDNDQYRFIILSNQSWTLVDARTWTDIFSRNDKHLTAEAGEENTIWLIAQDTKAYLFINGSYIQDLDISSNLEAGDVSAATGLHHGNETNAKATKFHDFIVWSLP